MSDKTTLKSWDDGLSETATKGALNRLKSAEGNVQKGEACLIAAGRDLRVAFKSHLKGDRARFNLACRDHFGRGASAAYIYMQAADAHDTFAADVKSAGIDPASVGVRSWALLDRFQGAPDEGRKAIAAEVKAAKTGGTNGQPRQPFSYDGFGKTLKGEGATPSPVSDRRVKRIESAIVDDIKAMLPTFEAAVAKGDLRAVMLYALRIGAELGSRHGAATAQAITGVGISWATEDRIAKAAAEKAAAIEAAANEAAKGPAKPEPKPAATVADVTATAPRRQRGAVQAQAEAAKASRKRTK